MDELCVRLVLSEADECRRPGELTVTYNPSFSASVGRSSPADAGVATAAAGLAVVNSDDCVSSLAGSTQTSPGTATTGGFSPPPSTCQPHTSTHDARQPPAPLHRPHSVTGLLYHRLL